MKDIDAIKERALATGFLKADGTPISLNEFKKTCSVHNYGSKRLKRIYFGAPNSDGMLSLFPNATNQVEAIKECYLMLIDILINGETIYLDPYYIRIREKYSISYGR
jgi:hypothetical protein